MCYDHRPCSTVNDPQKDYCSDRITCDGMGSDGTSFTINLPDQGAMAELGYADLRTFEAVVLSRFISPYQHDAYEQITISVVPKSNDDAPNRNLIYLEVDRTPDVAAAEAVTVDLSTDVGPGTVTIYSACSAQ